MSATLPPSGPRVPPWGLSGVVFMQHALQAQACQIDSLGEVVVLMADEAANDVGTDPEPERA